jgi:ribose transport system substrate-binding protein
MRQTLALLLALLCLAPAGCGGGKSKYKYRVAVIPKGLTHEHWQSVHRGADRAAADLAKDNLSVEILWDGPRRESDALDQINIVDVKLGQNISGLVLAPQHSEQMVAPVERAVARNVTVVILDSGLQKEAQQKYATKYVATDNYNGGKLAAEHLLQTLAKEGKSAPKLILFRYHPGSESTEQREQGFLDRVEAEIEKQKKAGQPAIEIISKDKYAGATVDSAEKEAGPLLTRLGKEADGIFAVNESSTSGMLNALRSQGLNKKITLMGFDTSEPLLQAIREGDLIGTIAQDPYRMGYLGVWVCVRHLEGDDVKSDGLELSTGEYVVTKENLETDATRELFTPELQAKRVIKTPSYKKK